MYHILFFLPDFSLFFPIFPDYFPIFLTQKGGDVIRCHFFPESSSFFSTQAQDIWSFDVPYNVKYNYDSKYIFTLKVSSYLIFVLKTDIYVWRRCTLNWRGCKCSSKERCKIGTGMETDREKESERRETEIERGRGGGVKDF